MSDKNKQQTFSRQGSKTLQQSDSSRKGNGDSIQSKPWPKNPRRRENNKSLSTFSKPEAPRHANPGKNRAFVDKRPKPRSNCPNDSTSTSSGLVSNDVAADSEGSIDFEIELNSIYTPGSKKQNLNHLLNFNYVPREDSHNVFGRYGGGNGGSNYRKSNIKKPKYNKEQYLQANFQFVINTAANQHLLTSCPDTLIDWKLIEQINIQTTEEPQCPICLFPPIAPKLTRCGHVYCWPCILHYLALSDKTWRKCPICYEAIHQADLKSTAIIQQSNFNVGNEITFQLMRRKKGSTAIERATPGRRNSEKIIHVSESDENRNFSKFLVSDVSEILAIIEREKSELLLDQDSECPEFVFIQQALALLEQRKSEVIKDSSPSSSSSSTESSSQSSDEDNEKYYYFYQSEDAQNIFLHPLNIKMLQTMYDSLSEAPEVIKGKILQKESQSMDEILRRKFTCLGHLPLTCQFEIVEIEIKYPYVSKEVADAFKDEIILREKTRQRRAREEKKREKHINEINDRQMGKLIARSANIDINSDLQFPICGFDEPLSPNSGVEYSSSGGSAGVSFANVMSSPKKEFWPTLSTPSQFQSFAELSCVKPPTVVAKSQPRETLDSDTEDQLLPKQHSIGDVLSEALQAKETNKAATPGGNKKSKKNNKKTLLFSSGMNYKGN